MEVDPYTVWYTLVKVSTFVDDNINRVKLNAIIISSVCGVFLLTSLSLFIKALKLKENKFFSIFFGTIMLSNITSAASLWL